MKSRDKRSQVGAGHAVQEQLLPTASENGPETVQKAWPEGSEWRKWDLHVHSPASENFTGDFNQLIIQLGNADCAVIGINDYFSVAGYGEVRKRLSDPGEKARGNQAYREALVKLRDKTLLPVVECRMQNVVLDRTKKSGPRINFHIIFSPDVPVDDIETFIKGLMVKGAQIGTHYNDKAFLLNDASVDFFETLKKLRSDSTFANRVLLWIPYDEYGGIDKINPATDPLFKQGLVFEADILGSSNKRQSEFFLWRDNKVTEEQFKSMVRPPKTLH